VPLVVFDEALEHLLRIDRVLTQPLGHLLLVGASGAGKTVLTRFVAWMRGMTVFQVGSYANVAVTKCAHHVCSLAGQALPQVLSGGL